MSSDDEWFKRWGKMMPVRPWSYADVDEMMKEMEREFMALTDIEDQLPKELVREKRAKDGSVTREIGPIVYGYSMTVGPDGKPVVREFGNVKPGPSKEWREAHKRHAGASGGRRRRGQGGPRASPSCPE